MRADGSSWSTYFVDANGRFRFDSLEAGSYVIGIRLPGDPPWEFGGASRRAAACRIGIFPRRVNRAQAADHHAAGRREARRHQLHRFAEIRVNSCPAA